MHLFSCPCQRPKTNDPFALGIKPRSPNADPITAEQENDIIMAPIFPHKKILHFLIKRSPYHVSRKGYKRNGKREAQVGGEINSGTLPEKRDLKNDEEKECKRSNGRDCSSPFPWRRHSSFNWEKNRNFAIRKSAKSWWETPTKTEFEAGGWFSREIMAVNFQISRGPRAPARRSSSSSIGRFPRKTTRRCRLVATSTFWEMLKVAKLIFDFWHPDPLYDGLPSHKPL